MVACITKEKPPAAAARRRLTGVRRVTFITFYIRISGRKWRARKAPRNNGGGGSSGGAPSS